MSDKSRALARNRQRARRARQRVGLRHYTVVLDEVLVEDGLIGAGLVPESRADDHEAAALIFTKLLSKWLERRSVTRNNSPREDRVASPRIAAQGEK
jgi:hypothetical protein